MLGGDEWDEEVVVPPTARGDAAADSSLEEDMWEDMGGDRGFQVHQNIRATYLPTQFTDLVMEYLEPRILVPDF